MKRMAVEKRRKVDNLHEVEECGRKERFTKKKAKYKETNSRKMENNRNRVVEEKWVNFRVTPAFLHFRIL